ncbi:sugar-transfer associated ATP-grasp domain-containing protein [Aeromicrobium sp.]|uniref:sugar-transfer associated ATP-grasp domain-containing protein n=1 Tax=Aeromicrobium sp. TaxID=1871063 RepID=UPI002FC962EB
MSKRVVVGVLARPLISQGFTEAAARRWVREIYRDWLEPETRFRSLRRAHREGFTSSVYGLMGRAGSGQLPSISQRDYHSLHPLNHSLHPLNERASWLSNRIVAARTVRGLAERMDQPIAIVTRLEDELVFAPLDGEREVRDVAWLLELLRQREAVRFVTLAWGRGPGSLIAWTGEGYTLDGEPVTPEQLRLTLLERDGPRRWLLTDCPEDPTPGSLLRLFVGRHDDGHVRVLDAEVLDLDETSRWGSVDENRGLEAVIAAVERIFTTSRASFTFIAVDVVLGDDGQFMVVDIDAKPSYPGARLFDEKAAVFLSDLHFAREHQRRDRADHGSFAKRTRHRVGHLKRRFKAFALRAYGFTGRAARSWVWHTERDKSDRQGFSSREINRAHAWGFTPTVLADFGVTEENRSEFISIRDYLYARPLNGKYAKWIRNRVSALMVFAPFQDRFDTVHYQLFRRGGELHIVPISTEARRMGVTLSGIAELIATSGNLVLAPTSWQSSGRADIAHDGSKFLVDGIECAPGEFHELLSSVARRQSFVLLKLRDLDSAAANLRVDVTMLNADGTRPSVADAFVVAEGVVPLEAEDVRVRYLSRIDTESGAYEGARAVVQRRVQQFAKNPSTGEPFAGVVPAWHDIVEVLKEMGAFAPQLRLVQFTLAVSEGQWRIQRVAATPHYNREFPFSSRLVAYLQDTLEEKKSTAFRLRARVARGLHNAKLKIRREYAAAFFPKGLLAYQSVRWPGDVWRDLVSRNGVALRTKIWAYRNGYLSYRIPQYGITAQNRHQFISDFEYRWLRHINERYKFWLEDKVSIKYVASDFNEYLPAYYFYTARSHGRNHVVPMMDCPEGYGAEYGDVLRLARQEGTLALKPDDGSHGEGFFRLDWDGDGYSLNGDKAGEQAVIDLLEDPKNQYLITEYIEMHPTIAEIYPKSVNTIRMIVFKKDGTTPELGNAYLRIGSSASGYVDNTAAGGMLAEIDVESGRFGNAQALVRGRVVACPRHPDTDVLIEGVVPNWEDVKAQILRMADSFSQLEYLGFDVAITVDGFKLPEINRFPDFPRIDRLTPATIDYLFHKLDQKKQRYRYDTRRSFSFVSLPKRGCDERAPDRHGAPLAGDGLRGHQAGDPG